MRVLPLLALLWLALVPAPVEAAVAVTAKEVEEALTCQCGCGLTVHSCNHLQCGSGIPLKQEVRQLLDQGLGGDEILARFRGKYGEKILSSPTTEGFNLAAWVFPFVMLGAGVVLVVGVVRRWTSRETAAAPVSASLSTEERRKLDEALRDMS
ncbi:MAG: cytochrome c-type biosis protein CcmH [Candidatus Binatota bacterium]|nr:cytochrome c-type biosis protein CcmH [Candidatus Binatota bacterium]